MKARVLIDNITGDDLVSEWGLSFHIEHGGHVILLDTGASGSFALNAERMGIDLAAVEYGVLSHAHFDHSDGMARFFELNGTAKFHLRAGAAENCYGRKGPFHDYCGIHRGYLRRYAGRIAYAEGRCELFPGATLIPHTTEGLEKLGKKARLYVRRGLRFYPDPFAHEQSLVLETEKGLAVFNSCCHGGAANIVEEAKRAFPGKRVYALLGGFHLYETPDNEVRALAASLKETGVERLYTGHCTGKRAFGILRDEFGAAEQFYSGMEIEL